MPRTKYARKPRMEQTYYSQVDSIVKDFQRKADLAIAKMEADSKMEIKSLETFVDVALSRMPPEIRHMTLDELLRCKMEPDFEKENCYEISTSVSTISVTSSAKNKKIKRITATSDDGYITEDPISGLHVPKATKLNSTLQNKTRSSSRQRRTKLTEVSIVANVKDTNMKKKQSKNIKNGNTLKTPASVNHVNEYGFVTPKIKPNTPLNILRRPRQGEIVLSMQGSPLLVSAVVQEETANINVPLNNGNMVSLLPNDGLRMSHFPSLDPQTIQQLETLKNHIETVIQNTNK